MRLPVLTADERRMILFVIAAFLTGLAAKYYREHRPPPQQPAVVAKATPAPAKRKR